MTTGITKICMDLLFCDFESCPRRQHAIVIIYTSIHLYIYTSCKRTICTCLIQHQVVSLSLSLSLSLHHHTPRGSNIYMLLLLLLLIYIIYIYNIQYTRRHHTNTSHTYHTHVTPSHTHIRMYVPTNIMPHTHGRREKNEKKGDVSWGDEIKETQGTRCWCGWESIELSETQMWGSQGTIETIGGRYVKLFFFASVRVADLFF